MSKEHFFDSAPEDQESDREQQLFALFGKDKLALSQSIYDRLKSAETEELRLFSDEDEDASVALSKLSESQVFDFMYPDISLKEILDPVWDAKSHNYWLQEMNRTGNGGMIDTNGNQASPDIALRFYVQSLALSQICTAEEVKSPEEVAYIADFRRRFHERFRGQEVV